MSMTARELVQSFRTDRRELNDSDFEKLADASFRVELYRTILTDNEALDHPLIVQLVMAQMKQHDDPDGGFCLCVGLRGG